jgi:hypothetical protein
VGLAVAKQSTAAKIREAGRIGKLRVGALIVGMMTFCRVKVTAMHIFGSQCTAYAMYTVLPAMFVYCSSMLPKFRDRYPNRPYTMP